MTHCITWPKRHLGLLKTMLIFWHNYRYCDVPPALIATSLHAQFKMSVYYHYWDMNTLNITSSHTYSFVHFGHLLKPRFVSCFSVRISCWQCFDSRGQDVESFLLQSPSGPDVGTLKVQWKLICSGQILICNLLLLLYFALISCLRLYYCTPKKIKIPFLC